MCAHVRVGAPRVTAAVVGDGIFGDATSNADAADAACGLVLSYECKPAPPPTPTPRTTHTHTIMKNSTEQIPFSQKEKISSQPVIQMQ